MFNEVDHLILNSFIECPHCGISGKNIKCDSFTTTIAAVYTFTDMDGHDHEHDSNHIVASYRCTNGHKFNIIPLNSCWCGWKQNFKTIGSKDTALPL